LDAKKAMGTTKKELEDDEPPLELEMRNRHVRTTETMVRNWVMYTKLLIQRVGAPQTKRLVDKAKNECRLEPDEEGNIIAKKVNEAEMDYRETEEEILDLVLPEDDKLRNDKKVFFKDE